MTRGSGPTVRDITPHVSQSRAGSLPKLATTNVPNEYESDPLVQYLKKTDKQEPADGRTMGKSWPEGKRPHDDNQVEDNCESLPLGEEADRLVMEDPQATDSLKSHGIEDWRQFLRTIFDSRTPPRDKCREKDHPATVGEVDALLKKFA